MPNTIPNALRISGRAVMLAAAALTGLAAAGPAQAQTEYRQKISNDMTRCQAGKPSAVMVTVDDIKSAQGTIRVQLYRGTKADWLEKGRWLYRIEAPARAGTMTFCLPAPGPGTYGVAVRHDVNKNGSTDITQDGGAMSNNPSLNVFNLGKPSYKKTAFEVGNSVKSIRIQMRYL
ncbi:uncharacterized protein (DUF2141 family) [Altererythrobacter atlanticus]|uniref:Uncharacterized protein n=1 Tax=Croceibacterium atlanticum TaxID=1267766 RepID=A0A0F7KRX9_9SPHN|nr:DUF2141 domain-containing protein [Croceibacterium atlanticum]AKH43213.1 hypothetical protein WYH_02180 [Croceibacterium atlanticum]MBB5732082.1 uncharacterized protein (DUF2141 family) [Croceibacterium atlanticum]